jgi:hypothetical protein
MEDELGEKVSLWDFLKGDLSHILFASMEEIIADHLVPNLTHSLMWILENSMLQGIDYDLQYASCVNVYNF